MTDDKVQKAFNVIRDHLKDRAKAKSPLKAIEKLLKGEDIAEEPIGHSSSYPIPTEVQNSHHKCFALFSDGACRGNPGPGAWGAMGQAQDGELLFESSGMEMSTTNNRMELLGGLEAINKIEELINDDSEKVEIWLYSDSKYLVDGLDKWVPGWKKRGWKKADKKTPENLDLWQLLDEKRDHWGQYLKLRWVKGHSGHPQNERCDQLANLALDETLGGA